jgi:tetratricopeptide (TPR) repeat protein
MSVFSFFLAVMSISHLNYYKKWQKAYLYSMDKDKLKEAEIIFSEIYPIFQKDGRYLITYSNLKYLQGDQKQALKLLEEAELYFCDISMSLRLAKYYEKMDLIEKAKKKFDLAINIAPDKFTVPYEKILFLINIGEYNNAYTESLRLINKPIKETNYADPYIIKSKLKQIIAEYEKNMIINVNGI